MLIPALHCYFRASNLYVHFESSLVFVVIGCCVTSRCPTALREFQWREESSGSCQGLISKLFVHNSEGGSCFFRPQPTFSEGLLENVLSLMLPAQFARGNDIYLSAGSAFDTLSLVKVSTLLSIPSLRNAHSTLVPSPLQWQLQLNLLKWCW